MNPTIKKRTLQQWTPATVCGLVLAGSMAVSQAQPFTNILISSFDTSGDPYVNMAYWWGGDVYSFTWDGTQNCLTTLAPNNPGSGALKITADWTDTSGVSGNQQPQFCFLDGLSGGGKNINPNRVNGFYYDLDFDIMFDPSSARSAADGSFGNIQAGFGMPDWSQRWVWFSTGFTNQGWTHVHQYIDPALLNIDQISGFAIWLPWQTSTGNTNAFYTNASQVTTFWLDNIVFQTNLNKNLNPPTLTLTPFHATPGLRLSSAGASLYDCNSIESALSQTWVGKGNTPVSYSFTVAQYPGTNYPYLFTHIFLCSNPGTEVAPYLDEANVVVLGLLNNPDASAAWYFRYKTNEPNDVIMYFNEQPGGQYGTNGWGQGTLAILTDPKGPLGTWTVTFLNDTNVTMTSPSGLTTNFFFPDAAALQTAFPDALRAYFGELPWDTTAIGQEAVLSEVKLTGTDNPIDDHFTGSSLDTTVWTVRATQAGGVAVVPNDIAFKLTWTLPDQHFSLQMAPTLNGPWTDPGLTNTTINGATKTVLVPRSILPSTGSTYFRMLKRAATKLQVLMPGETAAPGTPSGKTGTPDPQFANLDVAVTVNAVDNNWTLADSVTDTVAITSSDATASLPNNAPLANGTLTFHILFGTPGSWTVTATDVTSTTVAPNTGSPTTVQ